MATVHVVRLYAFYSIPLGRLGLEHAVFCNKGVFFCFFGCPSADVSAGGNGGPQGFAIPGTTSSTLWTGVNEDHLYVQIKPTGSHAWYSMSGGKSDNS